MQWWPESYDCELKALMIAAEIATRYDGQVGITLNLPGLRVVTRKLSDLLQLANSTLCHQIDSEAAQPMSAFVVFSSDGR
jgi:hypothetical protein